VPNVFHFYSPKINEPIEIEIAGNGEWQTLYAIVVGRTGIVYNEVLTPQIEEDESKTIQFEFTADRLMAPTVNVIVYYFQAFGEIVFDQIQINVDVELSNTAS
jgi:hypothetical protein